MKIMIIGGISRSLVNFRGPLIRAMAQKGHEILACAGEPRDDVADTLRNWGVRLAPVPISRAGMRPWEDLHTCLKLWRLMRQFRPDLVLSYTIKPVVWGGLAARLAGVPRIYSLVTGLGYAFTDARSSQQRRSATAVVKQRIAGLVAKLLYRMSLRLSRKVFFQNPDDRDEFVGLGLVDATQTIVVDGSGVDVNAFEYSPRPPQRERGATPVSFLLVARMLRDKGICEYADAARVLRDSGCRANWHLVGGFDPNPSGIMPADVQSWVASGILAYHGEQPAIQPFLKACDVYVLPSYREGTPRTVLEAMATGRAIITTDAPGCRETIRPRTEPLVSCASEDTGLRNGFAIRGKLKIGANGILVPPRDAASVADAMRFLIEHPEKIEIMGHASRRYAEERYDVRKVNEVMLQAMGL